MNNEFNLCRICNITKNITEFHKNNSMASGRFNVCKKCHYIRNQKRRIDPTHKERYLRYSKSHSLFNRYGIYIEEYEEMVKIQNNRCLICMNEPIKDGVFQNRSLHVDHCHITGKIRGLLCHLCNRALGLFKERIDLIEKALQYLKNHS